MRRTAKRFLGMLVLALTVNGCQPFKAEKTIKLESLGVHRIDIEKPSHNQDVTVVIDSEDAPLDVYIVLEKKAAEVEAKLINHKDPDKSLVLASQLQKKEATVAAQIPANEAYVVFLAWPHKNTTVKYKITGK
jgi:hypothetical protein